MCGRFTQTKNREQVLEEPGNIELPPLFYRRYNIAPAQPIAMIRQDRPDRLEAPTWGFENPYDGNLVINARSETLSERPMFKNLVSANRCIIPADGFYEWKGKQPYFYQLADKGLFAFAGLWLKDRCVIITRAADANMQGIHDRMPVLFLWAESNNWLEAFHLPDPPRLICRAVSRRVNSVANDDPSCIKPADEQIDLSLFPDDD